MPVMPSLLFLLLLLYLPVSVCQWEQFLCFLRIKPGFHKDGDLVIGGFFPVFTYAHDRGEQWNSFLVGPSPEVFYDQ